MSRIYLDHNATTPLRPEVAKVLLRQPVFGNPSSLHWAGEEARSVLARGRAQVASLIDCAPEAIVFTSCATEANNTILRSFVHHARGREVELVTCTTEHPSVLETCLQLQERGVRVTVLPVSADGRLDPDRFEAALSDATVGASIMWVNNETGVIQPMSELASIAARKGVPFHTDGVQALGKIPLSMASSAIGFASFSAHKLGGSERGSVRSTCGRIATWRPCFSGAGRSADAGRVRRTCPASSVLA